MPLINLFNTLKHFKFNKKQLIYASLLLLCIALVATCWNKFKPKVANNSPKTESSFINIKESKSIENPDGLKLASNTLVYITEMYGSNSEEDINKILEDKDIKEAGSIKELGIYKFQIKEADSFAKLQAKLKNIQEKSLEGEILFDYLYKPTEETEKSIYPNDPYTKDDYWIKQINLPEAWAKTTGSKNTVIGIVDCGIILDHEDLKREGNIVSGNSENCTHGTMVAGAAAAKGNNNIGVAGSCWDCSLIGANHPSMSGEVSSTYVAEAMMRASEKARIVNLSLGFVIQKPPAICRIDKKEDFEVNPNIILTRPIRERQKQGKDVLWVFAAGNEKTDCINKSPASLSQSIPENTITVAATDNNKKLADFSNYGNSVNVAAPGVDIYSSVRDCTTIFYTFCSDTYRSASGTSFSAPIVSGIAGLIYSMKPDLTADRVKNCIVKSASESMVSGHNFGIVNAKKALDNCTKAEEYIEVYEKIECPGMRINGEPRTTFISYGPNGEEECIPTPGFKELPNYYTECIFSHYTEYDAQYNCTYRRHMGDENDYIWDGYHRSYPLPDELRKKY